MRLVSEGKVFFILGVAKLQPTMSGHGVPQDVAESSRGPRRRVVERESSVGEALGEGKAFVKLEEVTSRASLWRQKMSVVTLGHG